MIYVLTGSNWFGLKGRLDGLRAEFVAKNGELAVETIDGEEVEFERIRSAVESLPFLSEQKMVVINRLAKNKPASEKITELIEIFNESTLIVIVEPEIDKRSAYYKTLKKLKGFEPYDELDEQESAKRLVDLASQKGGQLSRAEASFLVDRAGNNQQKLSIELEKLMAYDRRVTRENIKLLVEPTPQSSIFSLLDVAFSGDLKATLRLYDDQRAQGTEPLNIVGMLAWQLHAVALVQAAKDKSSAQIAEQSGVKPFVLQKSQRIADRLDRSKLQKFTDDLLDLDIKFKTTPIDQDSALKNLLATISS